MYYLFYFLSYPISGRHPSYHYCTTSALVLGGGSTP